MCGICGVLPFKGTTDPLLRLNIIAMTKTLNHRGPDNLDYYLDDEIAIGHTRLSILDLSSAANQPAKSFSGRFIISFNGEIYNHQDLRSEIESNYGFNNWESTSDTSTLVNMFEFWDLEKILKKINGMFAFAVWDRKLKKLILARDRFGEKPLYFGWIKDNFIFGSELKSIKKHQKFNNSISSEALSFYTQVHYVPSPLSIYKDIYKLEPSNFIIIGNQSKKFSLKKKNINIHEKDFIKKKWWDHKKKTLLFNSHAKLSYKEKINFLDNSISSAVNRQLISDVPLGTFLSGGIDSTLMTLMVKKNTYRPIDTFTIGMIDHFYDESKKAFKISKYLGTNHHQILVSDKDVKNILPKINDIYDEPFADSSQIPTYLLCSFASKHIKVAISGDAGDELFGGYVRHIWSGKIIKILRFAPGPIKKMLGNYLLNINYKTIEKIEKLLNFFLPVESKLVQLDKKANKLGSLLLSNSLSNFYLSLISTWPSALNVKFKNENFDFADFCDFKKDEDILMMDVDNYLNDDILCKVDRASMASGLEVRVPFLDKDVYEISKAFNFKEKVRNYIGKRPIRDLLARYLPDELINQPKMGFGIPLNNWMRVSLKEWVEDIIYSKSSKDQSYLDLNIIIKYWKMHKSEGKNYGEFLWNSIVLLNWLKINGNS